MTRAYLLNKYLNNPTDEEWERLKWNIYNEMKSKGADGYYPITVVHRDDLEQKGYDASKVTDDQMAEIADHMADAYLDDAFWVELDTIAYDMEIPQKEEVEANH